MAAIPKPSATAAAPWVGIGQWLLMGATAVLLSLIVIIAAEMKNVPLLLSSVLLVPILVFLNHAMSQRLVAHGGGPTAMGRVLVIVAGILFGAAVLGLAWRILSLGDTAALLIAGAALVAVACLAAAVGLGSIAVMLFRAFDPRRAAKAPPQAAEQPDAEATPLPSAAGLPDATLDGHSSVKVSRLVRGRSAGGDVVSRTRDPSNDTMERIRRRLATETAKDAESVAAAAGGKPFLKVLSGSGQGTVVPVKFDAEITLGRGTDNDLVLSETGVSRHHAKIRFEFGNFHLFDNNSLNGIRCNAESVAHRVLEFGDRIEIVGNIVLFTSPGHELRMARPDRAIAEYERLLEDKPDFLPAYRALIELYEADDALRAKVPEIKKRMDALVR